MGEHARDLRAVGGTPEKVGIDGREDNGPDGDKEGKVHARVGAEVAVYVCYEGSGDAQLGNTMSSMI
jgi:hypothetical protein